MLDTKPKVAGTYCMAASKSFLAGLIHSHGARFVFPEWDGTDEEAIQAIRSDPREVFSSCDHTDEKGYCLGHAK